MPSGFKSDLTAIRAWVVEQPRKNPEMLGILDRWSERDDVERIWETITKAGPSPPDPRFFITWVLRLWIAVQETRRLVDTKPKRERRWRELAMQDLAEDRPGDAYIRTKAAMLLRDEVSAALGRKQADAHFQQFMRECSALFLSNCRKPLDDVVRVLAEIVFDKDVTVDMVRGARKNREICGKK